MTEEENWQMVRWSLAEKFGWTLDYIDSIPLGDIIDYWQIMDGRAKAAEFKPKGK